MVALTIGMATYKDFDGVYFTIQALRLFHDLTDTELLVVDNYGCENTREFVEGWAHARYVRATEAVGTAAPRDLVFTLAQGDAVLCCDSHVMFAPGAVSRLKAMSPTGMHAPCVFEGAVTGELFVRWLRRWLVPRLRWGTTVVMDTLSVHRHADVRAVLARAGCHLVYLPAYSPDFNPIELAFSKLKAHLRAVGARTFAPLLDAIGAGLERISIDDIAGYYRHCGFALLQKSEQPS